MRRLAVALLIALLAAGCARLAGSASPSGLPSSPPAATPMPTPTATAEPTQPQSAIDLLECDGPMSGMGGLADDYGWMAIGNTIAATFDSFLETALFGMPRSGYTKVFEDENKGVYTYSTEGKVKVVVVIGTRFADMAGSRYSDEELRSCDRSEYGPDVDMGEGYTVWARPNGRILTDVVGPEHCDWQSARLLNLTDIGAVSATYIRDPGGVFSAAELLDEYAENVKVPNDASPSGYRHDDQELWFSESDTALYVVNPTGRAERWPKAVRPASCL